MKNIHKIGKELFITSDEEIKEGDYGLIGKEVGKIILTENGYEFLIGKGVSYEYGDFYSLQKVCKKIILTTDQDLDGVQAIDDDFLEWFVKNPSCEEVEVIYGLYNPMGRKVSSEKVSENHSQCVWKYKIIIPKEEPKQETTLEETLEKIASEQFQKDFNNEVGNVLVQQLEKQETLEEAAERYIEEYDVEHYISIEDFIMGAKWQQERSYSEEEVKDIVEQTIEKFYKHRYSDKTKSEMKELWFEQFKKK
jgi:hypothetical protein